MSDRTEVHARKTERAVAFRNKALDLAINEMVNGGLTPAECALGLFDTLAVVIATVPDRYRGKVIEKFEGSLAEWVAAAGAELDKTKRSGG